MSPGSTDRQQITTALRQSYDSYDSYDSRQQSTVRQQSTADRQQSTGHACSHAVINCHSCHSGLRQLDSSTARQQSTASTAIDSRPPPSTASTVGQLVSILLGILTDRYWSYWEHYWTTFCTQCTKSCYLKAAPCLQGKCHFSLGLCSSMELSLADTWGV